MTTSDGKLWVTGYLGACSSQYWNVGERVVINKSHYSKNYGDYEIVNPDRDAKKDVWFTHVFQDNRY